MWTFRTKPAPPEASGLIDPARKAAARSLRVRLTLFVLAAILPLALIQFRSLDEQRENLKSQALTRAEDFARLGSERYHDTIKDARSALTGLATIYSRFETSNDACRAISAETASGYRWANGFFVIQGSTIVCSSLPEILGTDVSDRGWFRDLPIEGGFSVSDFFIARARNIPTSIATYTLRDATTSKRLIFAATLDLAWFDLLAAELSSKTGADVTLVDGEGIKLSGYPKRPEWVGKPISSGIRKVFEDQHGSFETTGEWARLIGFTQLSDTQARLIVGFSAQAVLQPIDHAIRNTAATFSAVAVIVGLVIWLAGERIFVTPIMRLNRTLRATLDNMDQGLIMVDGDDRIRVFNQRAVEMLGLPPGMMTNEPTFSSIRQWQYERGNLEGAHTTDEWIAAGGLKSSPPIYERRYPDGTVLEVRTVPLDSGGVVRTFTDITLRKKAEDVVREAMKLADAARIQAERASAAKSDFLASMSHEIRSPLNSVIGFTELVLDGSDISEKNRRYLEIVQSSGMALLTVVNDVLDFAKIEAGQVDLVPTPFDPRVLADQTVSMVSGTAQAKGLALTVDIQADVPTSLMGDADRLRQILLNLLSNAVKFTQDGHVKLTVTRETRWPEQVIRFAVSDTGIGIPRAKLPLLFKRFSQIDGSVSREFGGTGLGLAICHGLTEKMGGQVGVESEPGKGSTFWFEVPLPEADCALLPPVTPSGDAKSTKGRILVVDDIPTNLEIVATVLRAAGHTIDLANDGTEALKALNRSSYDLILMDVQMPGLDGLGATKLIRSRRDDRAQIPVIALTANVFAEQIAVLKEAGFNDHLGKPFKPDALKQKVLEWLPDTGASGPQSAAATQAPTEADFDQATYLELRSIMGPERTSEMVNSVAATIERLLSYGSYSDDLRSDAHRLVSGAGFLGLLTLSSACENLERVAADPSSVAIEDALARARHRALQARQIIANLPKAA